MKKLKITLTILVLISFNCGERKQTRTMKVTATAFNSTKAQTDSKPTITFWNDTINSDTRLIAVSEDLIDSGLTHRTLVMVEGFKEPFPVLDKMHSRWKKRIDIHMGKDIESARKWGEKELIISWEQD